MLRPKQGMDARYLNYVVQSERFKQLGVGAMTGAGGLKRVPDEFTRDFSFACPSSKEQERIANLLDDKTARIDTLIAEKKRLLQTIIEFWYSRLCHTMQTPACMEKYAPAAGWKIVALKRLCASIDTGKTPSGNREDCLIEDGTPWATPGDLGELFVSNSKRTVSDIALKEGEVRLYPSGSTLLVGIGATVGKVAHALIPMSANQQLNILVPKAGETDPVFLTLAVAAALEQVRLAAGAATLPIINQDKTGRLQVAAPDLKTQQEIREELLLLRRQLDTLQSHVAEHIDRLREYRSSLISAAVTGQIGPSTFLGGH